MDMYNYIFCEKSVAYKKLVFFKSSGENGLTLQITKFYSKNFYLLTGAKQPVLPRIMC